jgi:hypothetical protein
MRQLATALATVLVLLGGGLTSPAEAGNPRLGRTWASDGVLRNGCHYYRYEYKVRARGSEWSLELHLKDPTGETIASNVKDASINAKRGHGKFRFCRYSTTPGRFKIKGKLTRYDGHEQTVGWIKAGTFRLRRR